MGEVGTGPEVPVNPSQASVKMTENPQGFQAVESSRNQQPDQVTVQEKGLLGRVRETLRRLKPVAPEEDPQTGWGKGF